MEGFFNNELFKLLIKRWCLFVKVIVFFWFFIMVKLLVFMILLYIVEVLLL